MLARHRLGKLGEVAAAGLLRAAGYTVVGTGFRARRGEIDLVCRRGDSLLLVEVKTRSSGGHGAPAESIGPTKRRALASAAAEYRALSGWHGEIEFAVVSVVMSYDGVIESAEMVMEL